MLKRLIRRKRARMFYLDHVESDGRLLFEEVVKMDLEGIVCKRKDSPYKVTEKPSRYWVKAAKRKIPLNAAALAIVKKRVQSAEGSYLFPHRKNADGPMLKVNNTHDRALKKSKVRKFRLYDLRHTWATRAAESGEVDMATLAALLGHSKLNMVMRYAHPQEGTKLNAVKRLEKANAAR